MAEGLRPARAGEHKYRESRLREVRSWCRANTSARIPAGPNTEYINILNGLLYWREEPPRLAAHDPNVPSIIQLPVTWDPRADCPRIHAFLAEVLPDDCLDFFFEWAGYLLIPSSRMQVALLLEGSGDTGKSTLLAIIGAVLGDGSVRNVSLQKLSENTFAAAELHGCLANICADLDARAVRHSGTFKQIVAGDRMTVERKYEQPFSYRPYARLMFSANEAPGTADQSDAYYKRWMVLPMHRKVSQARQDPNLIYALTTPPELSGLLRESVDGLRRLIGRGRFDVAPSMGRAAQEYRARTDTVVAFVNEKCALDPETRIRSGQLYEEYRVWCSANNRQPLGQQRLIEHLQTTYSGVTYKPKLNGYPTWLGLTLATLAPPRDVEGATAPDEREDTHKSAPALYPETEEILNVARALGFPSVAIDRTRVHGTPAAWQAAIRRLPPDGRLKLYAELEKLEQAG